MEENFDKIKLITTKLKKKVPEQNVKKLIKEKVKRKKMRALQKYLRDKTPFWVNYITLETYTAVKENPKKHLYCRSAGYQAMRFRPANRDHKTLETMITDVSQG